MHIFSNKKLKRTLITFPKVAGTTVQNLLTPNFELHAHIRQHNNLVGWKTIRLTPDVDTFFDLRFVKNNIPNDHTVTVMYRNPIDRYISGVSTLLKDEGTSIIRYEDTPDNDFWEQKPIAWYRAYLDQLFRISGLNYDFDNVHTMRIMLYVFILGVELPNVEFVEVNEFSQWVKDAHQLPDTYEVPRENNDQGAFSKKIKKLLTARFQDDPGGYGNYINPDMKMYEYLQQHNQVELTFLRDLGILDDIFQEAYPGGTNPLSRTFPQPRWYMYAIMEWTEHGTCVPDKIRHQINKHIIQVIGRYTSVAKNGELNVRVQMQDSEGD